MTQHIISKKNYFKVQQHAQANGYFTLYVQHVIPAFDYKLTPNNFPNFYLSTYLKYNTCKRMVAKKLGSELDQKFQSNAEDLGLKVLISAL